MKHLAILMPVNFPPPDRFAGPDIEHYIMETDNKGFHFARLCHRRHDGRLQTVQLSLSNVKTGRRVKLNGVL